MKTTKLYTSALLLGVGLACAPPALAQHAVTPLRGGAYLLQTTVPGMAVNDLLLVRPDSVVLVDTTIPGFYDSLSAVIHGVTAGRSVDTLISTHWHGDHIGLNADFRVREGTDTIIAHWRTGGFMAQPQFVEDLGMYLPAAPPEAQPTEVVHGEKRLPLSGETMTFKTVENAHSASDLVVYLERANVVYTGDLYFGGMYPVIDRTIGGTVNGMLHALRQMLARIDHQTIVVPSHGPPGNRESVLEFTQMLETCRDRIRALIAMGLTEEQAVAAQPLADLNATWGMGMIPGDLFTLIVYRDLAPQRGS